MPEILFFLRFFLGFFVLLGASIQDFRSREIDDISWKGLLVISVFLAAAEVYLKGYSAWNIARIILLLFSAGMLAFSLRYFGIIHDGEAKIIFSLSVLFPSLSALPPSRFVFNAFFLSVFANAVILSLAAPLYFFAFNLKRAKEKRISVRSVKDVLKFFIGYYKERGEVNEKTEVFLGERTFMRVDEPEVFERIKEIKNKSEIVFVTPALPFAVFIFYGFIASVFYGDLINFLIN